MSTLPDTKPTTLFVALAGNPNSGKTSLFNVLTGLRHKVGNYPGVTVERIEGFTALPDGRRARVVDVPGAYSLYARAEDERIARDVVLGLIPGMARPDVIVSVVDATNLERNLYFTTQLMESGVPVVVALNMVDLADRTGRPVDAAKLEEALGVPVVPVVGRTGANVDALKAALPRAASSARRWRMAPAAEAAVEKVAAVVRRLTLVPEPAVDGEAIRLITAARDDDRYLRRGGDELREEVAAARARFEEEGIDRGSIEAECRYVLCKQAASHARKDAPERVSKSEKVDRILTHWLFGPVIYVVVMGLIFQSVYTWAERPMEWIELATGWFGDLVGGWLGGGMLHDLIVDGVIAGVGNIVVFVPQICLLFFFLTLLEDVGYLSRAAFLVDRIMRGVGLHGKAFIPLMSSFACAIPGIMATRSIESRRDRLVTILVAPLMSCSARLPVYALMIGAFIPSGYQGLTLLGMYVLSVSAALGAAWVLRKTILRGEAGTFIMELPGYKRPSTRHLLGIVCERGWIFIRQAGTIILAISVVLWALAYFPRSEAIEAEAAQKIEQGVPRTEVENWRNSQQIRQSYAGKLGRAIEPAIEPLGFDWRTGIGIVASFAAREVLVSTMAIVYSVGEADEESPLLRDQLRKARRPDGRPAFTWLSALSLMVFFVLACQCMSTLAIVKRETNSWRWPIFMFSYMTVLAYVGCLIVYQGGLALGLG